MQTVDSRNNWKIIDTMLETETDDWRKQMLVQLKEHVQAECGGDLDALLATMTDEPIFHNWSGSTDSGPVDIGPKGFDALKEFYSGLIASGSNRFEYAIERIIVGDDPLVTEGEIRVPFSGEVMNAMGVAGAKPGATYATQGRTVTFWPFSPDGKIIGEDIYSMTTDITNAKEVKLNPYTYGESS
jgi:hypothetical protein